MNELIKLNAVQAVEKLSNGDVSPFELIDAAEARILETDDAVNAMPIHCFERARAHAGEILNNRAEAKPASYLYGLPIAIKDTTKCG